MDQINFLADGWSYHEMNYHNLRPPLTEQEDEMIKNKCLRALRRMSISSRFFDDLDTQIIMNSASDPAGVNSNCEECMYMFAFDNTVIYFRSNVKTGKRAFLLLVVVGDNCCWFLSMSK